MSERWLLEVMDWLTHEPKPATAHEWGERLHEALVIAEAEKYATPESKFTFTFTGANEQDVATILQHLSPLEKSIVEIVLR